MDLVDLKRTDADKKADEDRWASGPSSQEDYPYGLSIHIDADIMAKMGLTEKDFDAGQPVMIHAEGFISQDSMNVVGGEKKRSMSIQFRKMAIDQGEQKPSMATALYGD